MKGAQEAWWGEIFGDSGGSFRDLVASIIVAPILKGMLSSELQAGGLLTRNTGER